MPSPSEKPRAKFIRRTSTLLATAAWIWLLVGSPVAIVLHQTVVKRSGLPTWAVEAIGFGWWPAVLGPAIVLFAFAERRHEARHETTANDPEGF